MLTDTQDLKAVFVPGPTEAFDKAGLLTSDHLGGKGLGLIKMVGKGIPVPPAVIIPTKLCKYYLELPTETMNYVKGWVIPAMREHFLSIFGHMPLVSVRSGAKHSMPGMMDTILNVGIDGHNHKEWVERLGKACADDSWKRLVEMYTNVVAGVPRDKLEGRTMNAMKKVFQMEKSGPFPDAEGQILGAIEAVFASWNNERAKTYRKLNNLPDDGGTACIIQAMVFGNMNDKSCTGVMFTRCPITGADEILGEYVVNGQGEDVVAGIKTPQGLKSIGDWNSEIATQLLGIAESLEKDAKDMQDLEFTVQDGKLYMLQCRNGKRTALAAVRIALDMHKEGAISRDEAISRVTLNQFLAATRPMLSPEFKDAPDAVGIPASNGVAVGRVAFSSAEAIKMATSGPVILLSAETTPDDIGGMNASVGILTSKGGATSHAAVVGRAMEKVCVVGCTNLVHGKGWGIEQGNMVKPIKEGSWITLDGATGRVWAVKAPVVDGAGDPGVREFEALLTAGVDILKVAISPEDVDPKGCVVVANKFTTEDLANAASKMQRGVIDLRLPIDPEVSHESDQALLSMFGEDSPKHKTAETMRMAVAVAQAKPAKGVKVIVSEDTHKDALEALKGAGIKTIDRVETLGGLIMAEGLCMIADKGFKATDKVMEKTLAMKKSHGDNLEMLRVVDRATPDQLKGDTRLAMTRLQLVQSLLKVA